VHLIIVSKLYNNSKKAVYHEKPDLGKERNSARHLSHNLKGNVQQSAAVANSKVRKLQREMLLLNGSGEHMVLLG
jgi:hypothetical protein